MAKQKKLSSSFSSLRKQPDEADIDTLFSLYNMGRLSEAEQLAKILTIHFPGHPVGWMVLGVVLKQIGRMEEALPAMRKTVALLPEEAEPLTNLGVLLLELGQLQESEKCCRKAANIRPDLAVTHYNYGNTLKALGRFKEAESAYHKALALEPHFAEAYFNLGLTLNELRRFADAEGCYRKAIQIRPDYAEAYNNLAEPLINQHRISEAVSCIEQAIRIKPDYADAHNNLGIALNALGKPQAALQCFNNAVLHNPAHAEAMSNRIFTMNYTGFRLPEQLDAIHSYGNLVSGKARKPFARWQCKPNPRRLKVGLVSGDFQNHPVGFFLENMLASIDKSRIELVAYSNDFKSDDLTMRIKGHFSNWQYLAGLPDDAAANLIHSDGVHILVDLAGHTAKNRLPVFAWKPAPIQATWLGYSGTVGVPQIDYILGDPFVAPFTEQDAFAETIWQLPCSYLCFTPPHFEPEIGPLPTLSNNHITFGCFNNLAKINAHVIELWAKLLLAIPNSILLLRNKQLYEPLVVNDVAAQFERLGIGRQRLILDGIFTSRADMLEAYNQVDIALDPFPYNGTTSTVESLWMGVPVISLKGDRFISRVGESILNNAGLDGWVAESDNDYIAKAVRFANDVKSLAELRSRLRPQLLASPLFDAHTFARHFEEALWGMWNNYNINS